MTEAPTFFFRYGAPVTGKVWQEGKSYKTTAWCNCNRCGGAGGSDKWAHTGWTCYDCGGSKGWNKTVTVYTAEKLAKLNAKAEAAAAKRAEKAAAIEAEHRAAAEANRAAFMTVHGELVAKATALAGKNEFLKDLTARLEAGRFLWTDAQVAAVAAAVARIEATEAKKAASEFVGMAGDRIEATVTVEHVHDYERPSFRGFGTEMASIVSMRTESGAALKWFTTTPQMQKGETLKIKATVKEHSEYKGERQTVVQRVKVVGGDHA